jgi:hypothetical protein
MFGGGEWDALEGIPNDSAACPVGRPPAGTVGRTAQDSVNSARIHVPPQTVLMRTEGPGAGRRRLAGVSPSARRAAWLRWAGEHR